MQAIVDLLGFYFLARFTERPLRFFGFIGLLSTAAGLVVLLVLFLQKLQGQGIADRPALLLGTLLLALGVQSIAVGLVAEIIVHVSAPTRRPYRLARTDTSRSSSS
jgi:dolichol-phosphate mannosyltransferase